MSAISLNVESMFNMQQNHKYSHHGQEAGMKRKDKGGRVDGAPRLLSAKKADAGHRLLQQTRTGASRASHERLSGAACPDTPPLLIQRGLLRSYHAGEPAYVPNSEGDSDLDPNDFDENVVLSQKQSFNSGASPYKSSPLKPQQPLPAPFKPAPESSKSSVVNLKSLASMFFRSPATESAKKRPVPSPATQDREMGRAGLALHRRRTQFTQSLISPGFLGQIDDGTPTMGHHPEYVQGAMPDRFGAGRRPSHQPTFSHMISNSVYPRQ